MRALLVVNPDATSTTQGVRKVLARALRSSLDLDEVETSFGGAGAAAARQSDHDLIVVLGGDGTVNDVTTGLIDFQTGKSRGPRLAVVPGGSTNVFARAIGMPNDAVEATGYLLDALENNKSRSISIGGLVTDESDGERTFLFAAGMGVDAHTVAVMERARRPFGRSPMRISRSRYLAAAIASLVSQSGRGELTITADGTRFTAELAIATTNKVWTYLGEKPLMLTPHASFDDGLGLFSVDQLTAKRLGPLLLNLGRHGLAISSENESQGSEERTNLTTIAITAQSALPVQADGEALTPARRLSLRSLPGALTVIG